ncbi:MAG: peptidyl-prolyl cis-trans isomerase [Planctomycetes bacterium]|nr:peptidyl-prolyl cis-trans isomerase [Planctomycetota bacterium]
MSDRARAILKEPLLHFLAGGAALFGLYAWLGGRGEDAPAGGTEIVVTQGRIRSLTETFARQWSRPPSEEELAGLVRSFLREEVLAREAISLGLDRDDTIVRRRLAQKMEFLSDDLAALVEPKDEDLRAYLCGHPEGFRLDSRFTFRQVFLDREERGDAFEADAARFLEELNRPGAAPDPAALGDSRMLEARQVGISRREVDATFGPSFGARLEELPVGAWKGPIESGYGFHLVAVEERTPGRVPALEEVREAVAREWSAAKRLELKEAQFQALLARYNVTVEEASAPASEPGRVAEAGR